MTTTATATARSTVVPALRYRDAPDTIEWLCRGGFSCLDPEGRLWNVGTYDPWA